MMTSEPPDCEHGVAHGKCVDCFTAMEHRWITEVAHVAELRIQRDVRQQYGDRMKDERDSLRSRVAELEAKLVEATKVKAALPFRWRCIECESGSGAFPTEAEAEMAGQEHASTCPARLKLIDQIAAYRLVVADLARGGK